VRARNLVSQDRHVHEYTQTIPKGGGLTTLHDVTTSAPDFGPFNYTAANYGSITSSISQTVMSAQGSANCQQSNETLTQIVNNNSESVYQVVFDLTTPTGFMLTWSEFELGATANVTLTGPSGAIAAPAGTTTGTLPAGQYTFRALAQDPGLPFGANSSYNATLTLPEPGSLSLVGSGLCGLLTRRRRCRATLKTLIAIVASPSVAKKPQQSVTVVAKMVADWAGRSRATS
jgi:hypothetical protein